MCIIFGMIERNALRVVTLACVPTASGREKLAHLRISTSRGKRRGVRYCRTILHRTTVLGTRLPPSFPIYLLLSSTYYLTSPNSRRSLSARSFSFSPNLLFSLFLLLLPLLLFLLLRSNSRWKCHRHRRARFPSLATTHISTKSFQRTPISARRGGTVARRKLQSSGIKGGSTGAEGEDAKRRRKPKWSVDTREESRCDNLRPKKGKMTELSSLSGMIAAREDHLHLQRGAPRTSAPQGCWTAVRFYKPTNGTPRFRRPTSGEANQRALAAQETLRCNGISILKDQKPAVVSLFSKVR